MAGIFDAHGWIHLPISALMGWVVSHACRRTYFTTYRYAVVTYEQVLDYCVQSPLPACGPIFVREISSLGESVSMKVDGALVNLPCVS